MGYRRADEVTKRRLFQEFKRDNVDLIDEIGIPTGVIENHRAFIYFLMHDGTEPDAPLPFHLYDLSPEKRALYSRLVKNYLKAGLSDPGIGGWILRDGAD